MKKRFTAFRLSVATLLISLIPSFVWGAPAGSIVAWGSNEYGELNTPPGDDFVAIEASRDDYHCLALRADGSLAGWGWNYGDPDLGVGDVFYGQATVPVGNDFKAIS